MLKILFICHGNICRSPMAEFVLKDMVKKRGLEDMFEIESAATSREEIGNPVYPPARRKLAENGIACSGHRAWQMTRADYDRYDMIICMDANNIRNTLRITGGDPDNKISLLLDYTPRAGQQVADPWYTGNFDATWRDVTEGCEGLLSRVINTEEGVRRKALEKLAVSVEQMRRSDAYTIEHFVPGKELMYRAAMGVYDAYDGWAGRSIAIIVGGGNNGGDGYALAGILKNNGIDSVIYKVSEKMSDDGRYYHDIASELGVKICSFTEDTDLSSYDVIVDCILGTGFSGEVRGLAADAIKAVNESSAYVISVDINSGMNGDTGEAAIAVKSDLTVSIGYYKQGLFRGRSEEYIGKLVNADIGIVLI